MAISKILNMKDSGKSYHGKSLKNAIDYITALEKTDGGRLVESINCLASCAFDQMKQTKRNFEKLDKRQGYHLILSFPEGEVMADVAMEITRKFAKTYLGDEFEAIYAVHTNTDCIHSHIIFNSVSFLTGRKYRYERGDWAKEIQPLMNQLCREYGLSELEFEPDTGRKRKSRDSTFRRTEKVVWGDMIKRDLDACILQANSMDGFLELLREKGYEIKNPPGEVGKYLAVRPPGMARFKRCKTLGEEYTEEEIRRRILEESITTYQRRQNNSKPRFVYCKVKRYRKAKMSGLQKKYFSKLYRTGQLKKRPYSQAWKYRDEISKMQQRQKQYLFLRQYHVSSISELTQRIDSLMEIKKEILKEKSQIFKAKSKCDSLFQMVDQMKELQECEHCYEDGDSFFEKEHEKWQEFSNALKKEGYSYDEVVALKQHYQEKCSLISKKDKAIAKEIRIAKSIASEYERKDEAKREKQEQQVLRELLKNQIEQGDKNQEQQPKR